jgi:hypothetical protein
MDLAIAFQDRAVYVKKAVAQCLNQSLLLKKWNRIVLGAVY